MAGKSPFLEQRQERMQKIRRLVETACPIEYIKIVGMIEVQYGLKYSTAAGYVNALVRAGYIEKDEHGVLTKSGVESNGT